MMRQTSQISVFVQVLDTYRLHNQHEQAHDSTARLLVTAKAFSDVIEECDELASSMKTKLVSVTVGQTLR